MTDVVLLFFCLLQSSALMTRRGEVVGVTTTIQAPCLLTALMSWGEGASEGLLRTFLFSLFLFSPFLFRKAATSCLWASLWVVEPVFGNGDHRGRGRTESLLLASCDPDGALSMLSMSWLLDELSKLHPASHGSTLSTTAWSCVDDLEMFFLPSPLPDVVSQGQRKCLKLIAS